MNVTCESFLHVLLHNPASVAVVGTGALAAQMRSYLRGRFRLTCTLVSGGSSADVPVGKSLYVLCASPEEAAAATLEARGVPRESIVSWTDLRPSLDAHAQVFKQDRLGLRPLPTVRGDVPGDECVRMMASCEAHAAELRAGILKGQSTSLLWLDSWSHLSGALRQLGPAERAGLLDGEKVSPAWTGLWRTCLEGLYSTADVWTDAELTLVNVYSSVYLALRAQQAVRDPWPERRLLFPSPGRCGGSSITLALTSHPTLELRVDHEGRARLIYRLLALWLERRLESSSLVAFLDIMLHDFDCLGGNPFCFLLPYLRHVPWFDCHLLKIERAAADLRESIQLRNFHYSAVDFVPNRTTAPEWGDLTRNEWEALPLEAKIDWYGAKAYAEIERGAPACVRVVRAPLGQVHAALNDVLGGMGWPTLESMPHIMTLPKDRTYSYDERIAMYARDAEARSQSPTT